MSTPYSFPVSHPIHAMNVTSPDFPVDIFETGLYTNLDEIRSSNTLEEIKYNLGLFNNELSITNNYKSILVSGHRGCGKSSELRNLHQEINQPHLYTSILISIEEEFSLGDFSQEKFYFTLFSKLVERMVEVEIDTKRTALEDLVKMLTQEHTKERTSTIDTGINATVETGGGFDLLGILKAKGEIKTKLSHDRAFTDKIVTNIRLNHVDFLEKVNLLLMDIRQAFLEKGLGKDIIFIIDGSEKIPYEEYRKTFVTNAATLKILRANMIICLSIQAWYEIENSPNDFTDRYLLPMLSTEDSHKYVRLMRETLGKRIVIDELFEEGALDYLIINAAGCIRQMYILVHLAIIAARGVKVNQNHANQAVCKEGKRLFEQLNQEFYDILKNVATTTESTLYGDANTIKLLFGLQLLKYNGNSKVNPVITEYMRIEKNESFN